MNNQALWCWLPAKCKARPPLLPSTGNMTKRCIAMNKILFELRCNGTP